MKNFLIGILVLGVVIFVYLHFKPKDISNTVTSSQSTIDNKTPQKGQSSSVTLWNKQVAYDTTIWDVTENQYCTPGQDDGKRPCPTVGLQFKLRSGSDKDTISIGGHQPMACENIKGATKCDDSFGLVTDSDNATVLSYFSYLQNLFQR
jgi:hypothetical protein